MAKFRAAHGNIRYVSDTKQRRVLSFTLFSLGDQMNCKHCNLSMKLIEKSNRYLCETCQHSQPAVAVVPPSSNSSIKSLGETSDLLCQACDDTPLTLGLIHKTEVCFCSSCHGFAIQRGALADLVEDLRSLYEGPDNAPIPIDQKQLGSRLNCVGCQFPVETVAYNGPGNVVIASCDSCEISWINDGDLDRIVRAPGRRSYDTQTRRYTIRKTGFFLRRLTISYHD